MLIAVNLTGPSSGGSNRASITGGGAPPASVEQPVTVHTAAPSFGVSSYEVRPEEEGGGVDTQAGSHPFQLTTTITANELFEHRPVGQTKDLHFKLPPGLIGNPTPFPQCTLAQFLTVPHVETGNNCPANTAVGVTRSTISLPCQWPPHRG